MKMRVSYSSETSVLTYVLLQRNNLRTRLSSGQYKLQGPDKLKGEKNQGFVQ
jgi:hypothetical protein